MSSGVVNRLTGCTRIASCSSSVLVNHTDVVTLDLVIRTCSHAAHRVERQNQKGKAMSRLIDADSHFLEPLDVWERYIEPQYRPRCLRFRPRPDTNRYMILVEEDTRARFNVEDFLGVVAGFGQEERSLPHMVELVGDEKF